MYDKFGEMSSYTEINELAENLVNEGDIESLHEMAKENGFRRISWICIWKATFRTFATL